MKALILAAGRGQRMMPLTQHVPKPLLTVQGKPLIVYTIERLAAAGICDIVINTAYLAEKIVEVLGDGHSWGVNIQYSPEPQALETAGAILHASHLLGAEPFLLINGDIWSDYPLEKLVARSTNELGHLVLVDNPAHHVKGDFALDAEGYLAFQGDCLTYSGMAIISPALVVEYPRRREVLPLIEPLRWAIENKQLTGEYYSGQWLDIGTPERLEELNANMSKHA